MPQQRQAQKIDQLLFGLKIATNSLNESLRAVHGLGPISVPVPASQSKAEIVNGLMREIERRYGIAAGESIERKLLHIFDPMSFDALESWSRSLWSQNIETEWLSLLECLTVHETYFDRDKELLRFLSADILPDLIEQKQKAGDYRLRIWSAGCSSGEETYNLAILALMALKKGGYATESEDGSITPLPRWSVSVMGSDISSQMLRIARGASYATVAMGSFRDIDPQLWDFFDEIEQPTAGTDTSRTLQIKSCVSRVTRFFQHNLLEPLQYTAPFDLILCRNVLIYFNSDNKNKAQELLCRSLEVGGALVLGTTDTLLCNNKLEQHHRNGTFWYVNN